MERFRGLNESYKTNLTEHRDQLQDLDKQVQDRQQAMRDLEKEMEAMKIRGRREMEAEKGHLLVQNVQLQQQVFSLSTALQVRAGVLEDQLLRVKQATAHKPSHAKESDCHKLNCEDLEAIEKSLFNLKIYMDQRKPAESVPDPSAIAPPNEEVTLDVTTKVIQNADEVTQIQDLLQRLEKGIVFSKKRIAVKTALEKEIAATSNAYLIHQYHYEQFLHYLQYLRDLVVVMKQESEHHSTETMRFQRHYTPHLLRLYQIQASLTLKTLESVYELDGLLSHRINVQDGIEFDIGAVFTQLHELQTTLKTLRQNSTETVEKLQTKYKAAKKVMRTQKSQLDRLKQEQLLWETLGQGGKQRLRPGVMA